MDRRSFVLTMFGGLAAASVGSVSLAQAASTKIDPISAVPNGEIDAALKAKLDQTDADFSQVVVRERVVRRGPRRPVVVRRRVIVRRPPRRRVITRRVIRRY